MPWSVPRQYICPICGIGFRTTYYKQPQRCPACRKAYRRKKLLENYHQRRAEGRDTSQKRDRSYDGAHLGAPESVYASLAVIHLRYEIGACQSCRKVTDLINGYCDLCRGNGANEKQCLNPSRIK